MSAQRPAELFVVTSMVADWAGYGPAVIQWAAMDRQSQPLPWSPTLLVDDFTTLSPAMQSTVSQALDRFFTLVEAQAVGQLLTRHYPIWTAPIRYGMVTSPLSASEVLALQAPNQVRQSEAPPPLWRLRPPSGGLPELSLPIEGIVSLWPWPGLMPDDIVPLMEFRERLGRDSIPPGKFGGSDD